MGLKIRLRRMGRKKAPQYRIVVAESSMPRDGRYVDLLGHYNPRSEPKTLVVDRDKARRWLGNGAKPTETVHSLLRRAGVYRSDDGGVTEAAKDAVGAAASAVTNAAESVADAGRSAAAAVADTVSDVVEEVREAVTSEEPAATEEERSAE